MRVLLRHRPLLVGEGNIHRGFHLTGILRHVFSLHCQSEMKKQKICLKLKSLLASYTYIRIWDPLAAVERVILPVGPQLLRAQGLLVAPGVGRAGLGAIADLPTLKSGGLVSLAPTLFFSDVQVYYVRGSAGGDFLVPVNYFTLVFIKRGLTTSVE